MFEGLTRKLAQKVGRSVKEAAEPLKDDVKEAANRKVDLYSRVLRLGVLVFLFIDGTRRVADIGRNEGGPGTIIVNNYLGEPRRKEGERRT